MNQTLASMHTLVIREWGTGVGACEYFTKGGITHETGATNLVSFRTLEDRILICAGICK